MTLRKQVARGIVAAYILLVAGCVSSAIRRGSDSTWVDMAMTVFFVAVIAALIMWDVRHPEG